MLNANDHCQNAFQEILKLKIPRLLEWYKHYK